jgi:hypothetical protein
LVWFISLFSEHAETGSPTLRSTAWPNIYFKRIKMEELTQKLYEFSHNLHPGRVKMFAKYIRLGISVIFCLNFRVVCVFSGLQPMPEQLPDFYKTKGF